MNLKQMIEEAKMLAETPGHSVEDLQRTPVRETERSRSRRSESVVSVIEFPPAEAAEDPEPMPMSRRGVPTKRSPQQPQPPQPQYQASPPPQQYQPPPAPPQEYHDDQEQLPPPPLEEMEPPPPSVPSRGSSKATPQPPGARGRQPATREPSVGSDRYEEIIVETRRRSQSRSRMGSRTSSVVDFRTSSAALAKLDLDSIRGGSASSGNTKSVAALDLDTKNEAARVVASKLAESPVAARKPTIAEPPIKRPEMGPPTTLPVR